jgi:hypothetical protein
VKPEDQIIAIAYWYDATGHVKPLPDYINDLNAMHEAEKLLSDNEWDDKFYHWLGFVVSGGQSEQLWEYRKALVHATASQRAEALLRTIGKWTDQKSPQNPHSTVDKQ